MIYSSPYRQKRRWWHIDRIAILKGFLLILFAILIGRLFELQVLKYQEYSTYALSRMKDKIISARRGRILLKDGTHGYFELASNVSLELLFADPFLIEERYKEYQKLLSTNPERAKNSKAYTSAEIARMIGPLLFSMIKNEATSCDKNVLCVAEVLEESFFAEKRFKEQEEIKKRIVIDPSFKPPELPLKTEEQLLEEWTTDLSSAISKTQKDSVVLHNSLGSETIKKIQDLSLPGIVLTGSSAIAILSQITNLETTALQLEPLLEIPLPDLKTMLTPRPNRYHRIKNRIDFETAQAIKKLEIPGLGFSKEHWRNYAEQEGNPFAPQIIGFLDHEKNPVYGLEKSMSDILSGKIGHIRGEVDLRGRTLTARSSSIEQAVNGLDIVLSLDQVIQNKVEEFLEEQVKTSQARSGQVIVQDPSTGRILAMAQFPGFNPNRPGSAYDKEPIELSSEQIASLEEMIVEGEKQYFLPLNPGYKMQIFKKGEKSYFRYKNKEGIRVYRNSAVSDIYEPGSVFKAIVMAAAIDSKEIRPSDVFHDSGPLKVDCHTVKNQEVCDYTIKNSTDQYFGAVTMTQILEKSLNTGMAHIAKKLGPNLLYDYLKNFGFGEKTFIEIPDEHSGKLPHYRNWASESDMITKAFGQGIAATPLQVVNAISAVVNGGLLMEPTLISGALTEEGDFEEHKTRIVRRTISKETSQIMKSILVSSVERGYAKRGAVEGYKVGGKTGTSQIATRGLYEKGEGSTVASFAGFGPYEDPRFVILVKIDRPRTSIWGETNAGPLFQKLTSFMLNYLQIPPDAEEEAKEEALGLEKQ